MAWRFTNPNTAAAKNSCTSAPEASGPAMTFIWPFCPPTSRGAISMRWDTCFGACSLSGRPEKTIPRNKPYETGNPGDPWRGDFAGDGIPVRADNPAAPPESRFMQFCEQDYLLRNSGGLRTNLSNHGIDFEFFYAGSVPNNLDGGLKTGSLYQGALLMTLDLDSDKLVGYHGGTFHVGSLWLNGAKPFSDDYVGDLNKVNLLDFPNSLRLWELWYQQKFFDDHWSFKFGDLVVDDDFIVPEYYNSLASINFLNQTFFYPTMAFDVYDIPGFPPRNHGLPSTPNAAPGAVLRWDPAPQFYAQAAVYSGDPDQSPSGTRFNLSQNEGALSYFEIGYRLNQQKDDTGPGGSYKLGAWFHTGDFDDVYDGVTAAVFPGSPVGLHEYNYGLYLLAEQQLYREKGKADPAQQGLVGFFRV